MEFAGLEFTSVDDVVQHLAGDRATALVLDEGVVGDAVGPREFRRARIFMTPEPDRLPYRLGSVTVVSSSAVYRGLFRDEDIGMTLVEPVPPGPPGGFTVMGERPASPSTSPSASSEDAVEALRRDQCRWREVLADLVLSYHGTETAVRDGARRRAEDWVAGYWTRVVHAYPDPGTRTGALWLGGVEATLVDAAHLLLNQLELGRRLFRCSCGRFWFTSPGIPGAARRYCPGHERRDTREDRRRRDALRRLRRRLGAAGGARAREKAEAVYDLGYTSARGLVAGATRDDSRLVDVLGADVVRQVGARIAH